MNREVVQGYWWMNGLEIHLELVQGYWWMNGLEVHLELDQGYWLMNGLEVRLELDQGYWLMNGLEVRLELVREHYYSRYHVYSPFPGLIYQWGFDGPFWKVVMNRVITITY